MDVLFGEFGFVRWWTVRFPEQIYAFGKRTVGLVGDAFGVKSMLEHITEPIFQDRTWQGRIIGVAIRSLRVLLGLFVEGLFVVFFGLLIVLWYLFPFIAIWKTLL